MKITIFRPTQCTSILFVALFALIFTFSACSSTNNPTSPTPTAGHSTTSTGGGAVASATTSPAYGLGAQPCPVAVQSPTYWDPIIGTQVNVSQVARVMCGRLMGQAALQALILVSYQGTGQIVDVYVYNNITSPAPQQIFKLQNLYKGDAGISDYNTLLTTEVDQSSSVNRGKSNASYTRDLFREWQWSAGAGTLVQVSFPGIYPDLTRYQAETDQAQVNAGQNGWKLSATQVAQHMASQLLGWSSAVGTVTSGGGSSDATANVSVHNGSNGASAITVTMARLEGNTNGGIWIVTAVGFNGYSLSAPSSRTQINSPVTVTGTVASGTTGTIKILDHLYTDIGHADVHSSGGSNSFSTSVTYHASFQGVQEGLVMLLAPNNSGAVMEKELINA